MRVVVLLGLLATAAHADVPTGSIKGTVLFEGEPPDRPAQKRDADPVCAKTPQLADEVIVTKGKLRDVLVRVKNGTAGTHATPPEPVTLDQRGCTYAPHVLGVMAGQTLRVRNSDATFHNVHGQISGKNVWNKPHAPKDADLSLPTSMHADDVVEIRCDVHGWMHAYAVVQDHPFFAVTDDAGAFEIKGLPVGTYTLEAWHPKLGQKTLTVKIGRGKLGTVTARFSYKQTEQP
jgi:plastocyanin